MTAQSRSKMPSHRKRNSFKMLREIHPSKNPFLSRYAKFVLKNNSHLILAPSDGREAKTDVEKRRKKEMKSGQETFFKKLNHHNKITNQQSNRPNSKPTNRQTDKSTNQQINKSINQQTNKQTSNTGSWSFDQRV